MIRIVKPDPPADWLTRGATATKAHRDEYDASPGDYSRPIEPLTFTFADIYKAKAVKDALLTAQHSKCAFCESYFTQTGYGDIEHFRPMGGYKQLASEKNLKYPGYYWLAYEWSNLFYSCQLCNQRFKKNLFPLRDNRSRAHPQRRDISKEKPLLIDPAAQNPSDYIGFRGERAFAKKGCREGVTTIEALGLNREELAENRRKRLQDLQALVLLCELLREAVVHDPARLPDLHKWEAKLEEKQQDAAEYAAMARAFLGP